MNPAWMVTLEITITVPLIIGKKVFVKIVVFKAKKLDNISFLS